jgi:hypothetical protein
LDLWVEQWRRKQVRGEVIIVRYADDAVLAQLPRTSWYRLAV